MGNKLDEICKRKRLGIGALQKKKDLSLDAVRKGAELADAPRGFMKALQDSCARGSRALICEIKKASPSRGLIREDFDVESLARGYEAGGASCLSVLTDKPYFQGDYGDLQVARGAVGLPVLQKDFMLDEWQIYHARSIGADCILLIMAALADGEVLGLQSLAHGLGMDVLLEAHDGVELERAILAVEDISGNSMIGINNRNLKTLKVDLGVGESLLGRVVSAGHFAIAESGLFDSADFARLGSAGASAFLVGESLLRQPDITSATKALVNE